MTDPIGTAQEREMIETLRSWTFGDWERAAMRKAADALQSRIAEGEALREALRRIETGECVTDWADQPHEQMQAEARAALSLHRRPT